MHKLNSNIYLFIYFLLFYFYSWRYEFQTTLISMHVLVQYIDTIFIDLQ